MSLLAILGVILYAVVGGPLFTVLAAAAVVAFAFQGISTAAVISEMTRLAGSPVLVSIPLFTFAGYVFAEGKTPQRLVRVTHAAFGWMPGGLAIVAMLASAVLTAFTGASAATIVAMGGLLMPALLRDRYSERFSLGLLTTSGSLGLLFPPSLPLILYSFVATQAAGGLNLSPAESPSVDRLFLAGIVPGAFLIMVLSLLCVREGRAKRIQRTPFRFAELFRALRAAAWDMPLPVIVFGGIYSGRLTVMEAAACTALYALIVEFFIHRDVPLRKLPAITTESMVLVGAILIILGAAMGLTNYIVDAGVPMTMLEWMRGAVKSRFVFLLMLNILLLIMGGLKDVFSAIIVVVPLVVPIAREYHVNLVHLGIIFLTNIEIGYLTPPVGLNLFISAFRFRKPIVDVYRAVIPWLLMMLVALLFVTYLPELSLFLLRWIPVR
jgi:tripartite ATP-independent transporter DctM subunit